MKTDAPPKMLRVSEVAAELRLSARTIRALIAAGDLRVIRLSRRALRIASADLARYIDRRRS